MKLKNFKIMVATFLIGGYVLSKSHDLLEQQGQEIDNLRAETDNLSVEIDTLKDNVSDLTELVMKRHAYIEQVKAASNENKQQGNVGVEKTIEEEVEELLEESPEYREILEYISEITEEDIESFQKEVLDFYGITSKSNTFRFNPNNLEEAQKRIKEYALKMDSEENMTFETEYFINVTEEDLLVEEYRSQYEERYKEISEEERKEKETEFREKAAAVYYTKMNLKYLSDETLRSLNEKYHFVDDSETLIEDIKVYVNRACIIYNKTPLLKEMVANQGDYIAHSLLDDNVNAKREGSLIGDSNQIVEKVIRGDYGNGEERQVKLSSEGYNYMAVQEAVNLELGVVSHQKTALYRIENGEIVSNLPVLPTDKKGLCKYALIEKSFQNQYINNTIIYDLDYSYHAPISYDPKMVLVEKVTEGHETELYCMLYRSEDTVDSIEIDILKELNACGPLDFFETIEKIQKVTGLTQKNYK